MKRQQCSDHAEVGVQRSGVWLGQGRWTAAAPLTGALMSLEWLGSGCCAGCRHVEATKTRASDGCREAGGGARIQLRGLDTEQLKGSLVVLYAPAGNSCLLRLVGNG